MIDVYFLLFGSHVNSASGTCLVKHYKGIKNKVKDLKNSSEIHTLMLNQKHVLNI